MWIESIVITMPMFGVVCWFGALGVVFGLTLADTESMAVGVAFIAVAIIGFAGMIAFAHLSFLYLSRGLGALQQSSRRTWAIAVIGAVLALAAIVLSAILRAFYSTFHGGLPGFIVSIVFALIGAPLLIPFFHLLHLRDLKSTDEEKP